MTVVIHDLPLFLAHALTLEHESAERYRDLAMNLAAHHNPEVCELFERMAHYGDLHAAEVAERAQGIALPELAPWEYQWPDGEGPETQAFEGMHYRLTPREALDLALVTERQGQGFYAAVAAGTTDQQVRRLATEFAEEEAEHVRLLEEWIVRTPAEPDARFDDPDPPNAPA